MTPAPNIRLYLLVAIALLGYAYFAISRAQLEPTATPDPVPTPEGDPS